MFPLDTLVRNLFELAAVVEAGSAASKVMVESSFISLTADRIPRAHSEGSYLPFLKVDKRLIGLIKLG